MRKAKFYPRRWLQAGLKDWKIVASVYFVGEGLKDNSGIFVQLQKYFSFKADFFMQSFPFDFVAFSYAEQNFAIVYCQPKFLNYSYYITGCTWVNILASNEMIMALIVNNSINKLGVKNM